MQRGMARWEDGVEIPSLLFGERNQLKFHPHTLMSKGLKADHVHYNLNPLYLLAGLDCHWHSQHILDREKITFLQYSWILLLIFTTNVIWFEEQLIDAAVECGYAVEEKKVLNYQSCRNHFMASLFLTLFPVCFP